MTDTDVMIDLLREYPPAVNWIQSLGNDEVALAGFVAMELIQGCRTKREQDRIERLVYSFAVIWPTRVTCEEALSVFARFHLSHNIGIIDALIGQIAAAADVPLCTFNAKHYAIIPGLTIMRPYEKGTVSGASS